MNLIHEPLYEIDGVKSWIHCLRSVAAKNIIPQSELVYHIHDYIEILYSLDSDAIVWLNGNEIPFGNGDLVVINSNEPHTLVFNDQSSYICVKFSPNILYVGEQSLFELKYLFPFITESSPQKLFHKDELENIKASELILEMMEEWEKQNYGYELIIRANLLKLFAGIFRYWDYNNKIATKDIPDEIKRAMIYISENYTTVTEKEAAKFCGFSYNHFSYLFKSSIKKTFSEYLLDIKIKEAEKLLISTKNSITDIAAATGFSTTSYFISRFKEHKGITPKQFRKKIFL